MLYMLQSLEINITMARILTCQYVLQYNNYICKSAVIAYPCLLRNDCRLSVLAKRSATIMHNAVVVISSPKGVNGGFAVFVEIELVP